MKKNETNLILLNSVFVTSLVVSNILASKIVTFWGLVIPSAIVAYPITFLMTDVIGEIYGKDEANKTVNSIGSVIPVTMEVIDEPSKSPFVSSFFSLRAI